MVVASRLVRMIYIYVNSQRERILWGMDTLGYRDSIFYDQYLRRYKQFYEK